MKSPQLDIPQWLIDKINTNDQKLTQLEKKYVGAYYHSLTNTKLNEDCSNCIADAYTVIGIYLKKQKA